MIELKCTEIYTCSWRNIGKKCYVVGNQTVEIAVTVLFHVQVIFIMIVKVTQKQCKTINDIYLLKSYQQIRINLLWLTFKLKDYKPAKLSKAIWGHTFICSFIFQFKKLNEQNLVLISHFHARVINNRNFVL
jgi:hypothetical protein